MAFELPHELIEHTTAEADKVQANLEYVLELLGNNGGDRVSQSADRALNAEHKVLPGTEEVIEPTRKVLVTVNAVFEMAIKSVSVQASVNEIIGGLIVDGVEQPELAVLVEKYRANQPPGGGVEGIVAGTVAQSYSLELAAGAHTLKLWAACVGNFSCQVIALHTGYTYSMEPIA